MAAKWEVTTPDGSAVARMMDGGQLWTNRPAAKILKGVDLHGSVICEPFHLYESKGPDDEAAVYANVSTAFNRLGGFLQSGDIPELGSTFGGDVLFDDPEPTDLERAMAMLNGPQEGPGNGPEKAVQPQTKVLPAITSPQVSETHSGAMIALLPDAESAAKLAVPGGDDTSELHITLAYLGDDAMVFAEPQRDIIRAVMSQVATGYNGGIDAKVSGSGTLGPTARVYLVGDSDRLHFLHEDVWMGLDIIGGKLVSEAPLERLPWIAHLTAKMDESDITPEDLKFRGEVHFDRIRVAFGTDYTDFSLRDEDIPSPTPNRLAELAKRTGVEPSLIKMLHLATTDDEIARDAYTEFYKALPKTQKCKYCDKPATVRVMHAEGMAYIPTCDEHKSKAIARVGRNEVTGFKPIRMAGDGMRRRPGELVSDATSGIASEVKAGPPGAKYASKDPNATRLRVYWTREEGAAKIGWGRPGGGDFYRCVEHLSKYVGTRAKGLCAIYHRAALGVWPGQEGKKSLEELFSTGALGALKDLVIDTDE